MTSENAPVVRIAVAGTGFGGRVQIPGFLKLPGVEIIGVMSSGRPETARKVAAEFNIPQVCASYDELLQLPDLDAVSIVTPPYQHHEMTIKALVAGKHVLCEKPMAMNLIEAYEMLEASRKTGLIGMIDHEFRYVPARAYLKELLQGGWLGQLYSANISMLTGSSADNKIRRWGWLFDQSAGGGFLGALGSHYIDALSEWFGDISAVSATINTHVKERFLPDSEEVRPVTADDTFSLACRFARGGEGMINVSVVARFGTGERIELFGSAGTLVIDNEGRLYGGKQGDEYLQQLTIPVSYTNGPSSGDPRLRPFVTLAADFVEAIRKIKSGQKLTGPVRPGFADGVKVQQIIDAARQSAETSCWVSLPPPR